MYCVFHTGSRAGLLPWYTKGNTPHVCSGSGPGLVLGFQGPGLQTPSLKSGKSTCKYTFIHTHVCTGPMALPALPCSSGASHVIFPLLSTVMELPVLLERYPTR